MTRNLLPTITLALAALVAPMAAQVWADDAPTAEQLDAAKKAYGEGKQLHDQGKLSEAIEKFKESYRLSRNAVLLYNIGLTLDENKQSDNALFYYRKFLSDAPPDAAQRKAATDRVKQLETEKLEADLNGKPADTQADTTKPAVTTKPEAKIKPAGTYQPTEFQHQVVEDAPPGKALDISAFVPEDSGWTVTLYYRGAGDAVFVAKPMSWHYHQLIARVPASKVTGSSIQYYVEVKDQAGTVVTRSGKSTSPNLINLDASAHQHYFPDFTDDTEGKTAGSTEATHHDDEDPLNKHKHTDEPVETPAPVGPSGEGFTDVGSNKFEKAKWGTTIGAVALVGVGVAFAVMAGNQASALSDDTKMVHGTCTALPCPFDSYDADLQSAGQRDQTISNVAITFGVIGAVAAGYFWYRELSHKKHGDSTSAKATSASPEMTWIVAPSFGDHFSGAAAAVRF
ncbi:MAG: hypothetical protein ABI467_03050 [Kofleriaceae bacterium]